MSYRISDDGPLEVFIFCERPQLDAWIVIILSDHCSLTFRFFTIHGVWVALQVAYNVWENVRAGHYD